ncbi:3-oxoacyl-ACP synthase [Rhodococcus sp. 06-156-3C]|uniref:beta-ketoacyl-[acyl-carrier-protein] synthase family protein n=1 Tax=Nocardiaceae TaxID=85025 RepID=UPI0005230883|nr:MULTISPECIES: beta-ketoacyl-[acyl-carrier-protein] synthase family protein [Rhodococcus]OZD18151.1 3-oxoacyl-ACP synthase [Rhodococcus sp. 06-156-4C]OZD18748.1 3-oxoacyl-ACP synthase [Rhodococcus sp. 06-156-3C]OZD22258.1 3-oxoacyl-ACP synthase [Rhodococcus sp. 06-156-4a]OZD34064.1 3-oxoacyl-ACP synthase [Rhodococcus sp. 06-156-3b]OZD38801.1 3-oxoacyl-ACP synthase [Rhodococcus sp. 06-156-3]
MQRRVVITGLGPVSSIGIGAAAFLKGITAGTNGITQIESFDTTGFDRVLGGEVHDFDPADHLTASRHKDWGRTAQFAASAARWAYEDAGLDADSMDTMSTGAIVGTTNGEAPTMDALAMQWLKDPASIDPEMVRRVPAGNIAAAVASEIGVKGETATIPTACAAANYAIGYAAELIASGDADVMLAGGADSVNRFTHAGFDSLGAVAQDLPRPFDAHRSGIVTAEGGAMIVLEERNHAISRGAHIYAEFLGYAMNCDADHIVHPNAERIADCIRTAHSRSDTNPGDVDYICAHGTGTPTNDLTETTATRAVFGDAEHPPISSLKSMLGHTMGAASGFGAIACCLAIAHQFLPPTINLHVPDPALGNLDFVANHSRPAKVSIAQNHGFAFGGNNAITMFGDHA